MGTRRDGLCQLWPFVREAPGGRAVQLLISRNGATQTLTATIGSRSSNTILLGGDDFRFTMPEIRIPDIPRVVTSWQSRTLGVDSESLNSQLAEFFGVKEGVLVRSVIRGTAADKAGLKAGDVITKIGDRKVTSPRDISNAVRHVSSGKAIPVPA